MEVAREPDAGGKRTWRGLSTNARTEVLHHSVGLTSDAAAIPNEVEVQGTPGVGCNVYGEERTPQLVVPGTSNCIFTH